jgi:hypothetical protein
MSAPTPAAAQALQDFDEVLSEVEAATQLAATHPVASQEDETQTQPSPEPDSLEQVWQAAILQSAQMPPASGAAILRDPNASQQLTSQSSPQLFSPATARESAPIAAAYDAATQAQLEKPNAQSQLEQGATHGQVEFEPPSPELPPEIDSFVRAVADSDRAPDEILINGDEGNILVQPVSAYTAKPVIVLPYDQNTEKAAKFKSPHWAVKWLITWGERLIALFKGAVIYRQPPQANT